MATEYLPSVVGFTGIPLSRSGILANPATENRHLHCERQGASRRFFQETGLPVPAASALPLSLNAGFISAPFFSDAQDSVRSSRAWGAAVTTFPPSTKQPAD